jgi:hypothetical protein
MQTSILTKTTRPSYLGETGDRMLASVTRWRISETISEDAAFRDFMQSSLGKHVSILRNLGLLDILAVRVSDDILLAVTIYEDEAEGQAGWAASQIAFHDDLLGKLELISRITGPAFDLPQLMADVPILPAE